MIALPNLGADEVRRAAVERCEELAAKLLGHPTSIDRREMRWGSHGRLALQLTGDRRGLWYDFSAGKGGDMIDLVAEVEGCTIGQSFAWLRRELSLPAPQRPAWKPTGADRRSQAERIEAARLVYGRGQEGRASLARHYFDERGLDVPDSFWPQIRFSQNCYFHAARGYHPAVLLPFRDIITGGITGVHRIALNSDGSGYRFPDGRKLKASAGRILGAALMLSRDIANVLCVCEGAETGLGILMSEWNLPVWALSGASFLARLQPVTGVRHLVIGADNDANGTGINAARDCGRRWQRAGCSVDIYWPEEAGTDFADHFRRSTSS
jgi:hypothetical protein